MKYRLNPRIPWVIQKITNYISQTRATRSHNIQYPTMALAVLDVPPLTIPSLQPTSEFIDWSSPHKINPAYIDEVKAGIHRKFPPKKYRWSQSLFPAKDLKTSIFAKLGDSYNPFLLRLPYGIQCTKIGGVVNKSYLDKIYNVVA